MTEDDWDDPHEIRAMLDFVRSKCMPSNRRLRLFAVACCRDLETDLPDQESWDAVHVAEWYADGNGSDKDLEDARRDAEESFRQWQYGAAFAAVSATVPSAWDAAIGVLEVKWLGLQGDDTLDVKLGQLAVFRDIFGLPPFRDVRIDPAWRTPEVLNLAQNAYEGRDPHSGHLDVGLLVRLAAALEDAGCNDAELLAHLRSRGPHYRGCFAVDLLLGKS